MISTCVPLPAIESAIREACFALEERRCDSTLWSTITEDRLWRELVACILGSRIRFEIAHSALCRLEKMGLLSSSRRSSRFEQYEEDIQGVLAGASKPENNVRVARRYPFYRMRANQIRQAAERLYGCRQTIRSFLDNARDTREARRLLASEVAGLGPKQASLFLRNIGYTEQVAVLDAHVLAYMNWVGLTEAPIKSIATVKKYEDLENRFLEHACSLGYAPDQFDLAVWVVVRVAKEKLKTWE